MRDYNEGKNHILVTVESNERITTVSGSGKRRREVTEDGPSYMRFTKNFYTRPSS